MFQIYVRRYIKVHTLLHFNSGEHTACVCVCVRTCVCVCVCVCVCACVHVCACVCVCVCVLTYVCMKYDVCVCTYTYVRILSQQVLRTTLHRRRNRGGSGGSCPH